MTEINVYEGKCQFHIQLQFLPERHIQNHHCMHAVTFSLDLEMYTCHSERYPHILYACI